MPISSRIASDSLQACGWCRKVLSKQGFNMHADKVSKYALRIWIRIQHGASSICD